MKIKARLELSASILALVFLLAAPTAFAMEGAEAGDNGYAAAGRKKGFDPMDEKEYDFVHSKVEDAATLAPTQFTWDQLMCLKDGKTIQGELDGCLIKMSLPNPKELGDAWPAAWQVLSRNNFTSRIFKVEEVQENPQDDEIKFQTLSTYQINSNYPGGPAYKFGLTSKVYTLHENKERLQGQDLGFPQSIDLDRLTSVIGTQGRNIHGTYWGSRAIFNVFQRPYGDTYHPSQLRSNLVGLISSLGEWTESSAKYCQGYDERPMYTYHAAERGNYIVVSSPVHDLCEQASVPQRYASGNLAIKTVVEDIRVNPVFDSSDLKVLMPVAQSNKGRRHWTLLVLERTNNLWYLSHFDSKGFSSSYYSLENLMSGLEDIKFKKMDLFYLGHQGLINLRDCPRYVISYIYHMIQGRNPANLENQELESIFKNLDK
ncbi:MAG: hypothetical protein K0R76_1207 [Alphaproteobacteria bacterium]|jgi:hypothetical protein|nr:hypothetical protein [Alphaproteobacteria bacterium]